MRRRSCAGSSMGGSRYGLLDAVVEELEVFAAEAFDEVAGAVGEVRRRDAVDGDADGRGLLRLSPGQRGCAEQRKQDSQDWLSTVGRTARNDCPTEAFGFLH